MLSGGLLKSDEVHNNARGWTANLAIFRIVFLGFAVLPKALWLLNWTERILPGLARGLWVPVSFYKLLPFGLLSNVALAQALAMANILLVVLGLIGFCTRSTVGLATLLSFYLFGLPQNQGEVTHYHQLVWFMALLAASPSGQLLSIDALRRTIRSADRGVVEPSFPTLDALWTLRYIWVLIGLLYFGPGLAKAATRGWGSAANLHHILWLRWLELSLYGRSFVPPIRVDRLPAWLLSLAGAGVITFEASFVLAVLFRRCRPVVALFGLAFHVSNGLFLNIFFPTLLPAYVCLFDCTAIGRRLWHRSHLLVFYDGGCRFCRRMVAILRSIDLFDTLELVQGLSDDPRKKLYPQITDDVLAHGVYVVGGGRIETGFDAYVRIANRIGCLWPAAQVMRFPPVAALGRRLYRHTADLRRCPLAAPNLQAGDPAPTGVSVHYVGRVLVACQLVISSIILLYNLKGNDLPPTPRWLAPVRWPWPFDLYPTFTPLTPPEFEIWEARWVTAHGRELRVSPRAYRRLYANPTVTRFVLERAAHEPNPERRQTQALDLVRALWRTEKLDVRESVTAVRIYRVRYRLEPPEHGPGTLLNESLIFTFPEELLLKNAGKEKYEHGAVQFNRP